MYPAYPSIRITPLAGQYALLGKYLASKQLHVFGNGKDFLIAEHHKDLIAEIKSTYTQVIIEYGAGEEFEFATLATEAGLQSELIELGQEIFAFNGQTADSMILEAKKNPSLAKLSWLAIYKAKEELH